MENTLLKISYNGEAGCCEIRTIHIDDVLHICLADIVVTLLKENREINGEIIKKSVPSIVKEQMSIIESDEYILRPCENPVFEGQKEAFVTQPGLYRVLSADRSSAGKKFQKWIYHEVLPSIAKYGTYPAPLNSKGSALAQMAEIVALNSRTLADAIHRQERLESEVENVKSNIANINKELSSIKSGSKDLKHYKTVMEVLDERGLVFDKEQLLNIIAWCDNLSLKNNFRFFTCASGIRENTKYTSKIIGEAIELIQNIS